MQTKPKSNSIITHEVAGTVIMFHVRDAGQVTVDLSSLSEAIREQAILHGIIQKVSDAAAIARNTETGLPATPVEKQARMQATVEALQAGEWTRRRTGEGKTSGGLLLRALREVYPAKSAETLSAYLKARTTDERRALENAPAIKEVIDRMRAESVKGVDAEALLGELED